MQGLARLAQAQGRALSGGVLQRVRVGGSALCSEFQTRRVSGEPKKESLEEHGFESTTIADILKEKGQKADGSWLWCSVDDTVFDAVKSVSIELTCRTGLACTETRSRSWKPVYLNVSPEIIVICLINCIMPCLCLILRHRWHLDVYLDDCTQCWGVVGGEIGSGEETRWHYH